MSAPRPGIEAQREQILSTTLELLGEHGPEDLTPQIIAEAAGVSRATFYRAFTGVEAIVDTLHRRYAERVASRLEEALQSRDEPWLEAIVGRVMDDAAAERGLIIAMFREEVRPGSAALAVRDARVERQVAQIARWWRERTGLREDKAIIRSFIILLQGVGLHVALHPALSAAERRRLRSAMMLMISSTMEEYTRRQ